MNSSEARARSTVVGSPAGGPISGIGRPKAAWWRSPYRRSQILAAYAFVAVALLLFGVFRFWPLLHALYLSFTNYGAIGAYTWIGAENYVEAVTRDSLFWQALWITLGYAAAVVVGVMCAGLGLALALNAALRAIGLFRTAYYLPFVTSMVAVAVLWSWLYEPTSGLANTVLSWAGIPPQNWLQNEQLALPALVLMRIWKGAGFHMVIFLAALQSIPKELYEAAELDGARTWARFRYITLPLLKFALLFDFVIATSGALQSFEEIHVMTRGGPAGSTTTMVYLIYENAFNFLRMGYASAQAFLLFLVILVLTLTGIRFFRQERVY